MLRRIFAIGLLAFGPVLAFGAEIMFEGYYRIELEKKPIGYSILRYSYDPKAKAFLAASFLRAQFAGKVIEEGLKASCSEKFNPISYQYTSQVGSEAKTIDASFKGEVMTLKITDAKKKLRTETYKIPKGTFLSTFLPYLLLQQKLKVNEAFKYSAVAEEEGNSYWGKALLQSKRNVSGQSKRNVSGQSKNNILDESKKDEPGQREEILPGQNRDSKAEYEVFTILNKYKGDEFVSTMAVVKDAKDPEKNIKGEVLSTNIAAKNISTILVSSADQATANQVVPNKILMTLFDGIPVGKVNLIALDKPGNQPDQDH